MEGEPEQRKETTWCRSVLITGSSAGIGAACAEQLSARGWHVFAGVRNWNEGEALAGRCAVGAITPVLLDVTDAEQIAAAARLIRERTGEGGLQGVVNNAAIAVAGPLELIPCDAVVRQFQVNVFGAIAVTQAFLPMIRAGRGRIVFLGSNSGIMCKPFAAPYGASKHAIEAIADALRVELAEFGIHVALIQPGATRTQIWDKARFALDRMLADMPPRCEELYGRAMAAMHRVMPEIQRNAIAPRCVASAVAHALESRWPRTRYRLGWDAHAASILVRFFPDRFRDWILRRIIGI